MLSKDSANYADVRGIVAFVNGNGCCMRTVMLRPLLLLSFFALFCCFAAPGFAQQNGNDRDKLLTADTLKARLFAKTPDEKRFCDYVIQRRDNGTLPARLIYAVYEKAVTKDKGRRFAYFKSALEILCKQEGIALYPTPKR